MDSPTGSINSVAYGKRGITNDEPRDPRGDRAVRAPRPLRVLLSRIGDTRVELPTPMAHVFRQAGMEVVVAGAGLTPEIVCAAAIQEDVDVVCVSALDAENSEALKRIPLLLHRVGATEKLLLAGSGVFDTDRAVLEAAGIQRVFPIGADLGEIVRYVEDWRDNRLQVRLDG